MHIHRLGRTIGLVVVLMALLVISACTMPTLPVPVAPVVEEDSTPVAAAEPAPAAIYEGMPVGFTAEGFPYRGNPDAPITVYEFSDYECPFCARHVIQTEPALKDNYVAEGDVRFVFRDFPLETLHPNAIPAAVAANCVAEQGIVHYWQMHRLLFRAQQEWSRSANPDSVFARLAEEAGADPDLYAACLAETADVKEAAVRESVAEAQSLGFSGTPSFVFVNEESGEAFRLVGAQPYNIFSDYIDTMLAGGAPVDPAAAQQQQQGEPQIPYWAQEEGLSPDPDNPGFTVAGDFWRGNPDAPLVVVEFSDFQCPFCRQHALNTQPVLDEQFIDPGDVMWVFKHFPVEQSHPQAVAAAGAAQCAGYQGQFWEMHHLLFERTEEWGSSATVDAGLTSLAEDLGLDMAQFETCMEAQETYQAILSDLTDGSPFVRGTPTFVVLYGDQGRLIPGALPADQFSAALTELLAEARE
ncbi:MAG: thioredoxin domain-containing protein [Caldilineaceae bacterium]|nr:thioredoxin domain-containing protein [Caldilineaceae bacterium]